MSRTVLIVEDAETCSSMLEIALARIPGIELKLVGSGEEALAFLRNREICALITDIHLPRMNGFELIENVRGQDGYANLPILAISGDSDPRTPERLRLLGATAFFSKPYSPAQVREKLEKFIHASQL